MTPLTLTTHDGVGLPDDEYFVKGTSPLLADTDRDGVPDGADRVPMGDAFVEIRIDSTSVVGSDPHNAGGVPLPFAKASLRGNDTYTPRLSSRSGSWTTMDYDTLNVYAGHRLAVDVPDDGSQVWITIAMWSYDSRERNEHTPIIVGSHTEYLAGVPYCVDDTTVSIPYSLQTPGGTTSYQFRGCSGSSLRANPLNVTLATIVPERVTTDLIVPADYSGVYNVTDASGAIVGRRYVGEPRFVAILLNATTWEPAFHCYCGPQVPMAFLIPRSVFVETRLYAHLNSSNPITPLDKLAFRQNDTAAKANSDALQQLLSGNVTMGDWLTILDLLRYNSTNVLVRAALRLTNDLLLFSLPDDAIRLVAYRPPLTAPSTSYTFCSGSCGPPTAKPWWEQVWTGIVSVVTSVLTSAIVLALNAFAKLVEILAQVGAWIWTAIVGAAQAVASAVQAAAKVLEQVVDWVITFVMDLLKTLFEPVLDAIDRYLASVRATVQAATVELLGTNPSPDEHADRAAQIVTGLLLAGTFLLFLALAVALLAVDLAAKPITALAGLVVPLITSLAMGLILGAVAVGLFPVSNADTGNSPDNVDSIPEFVVDYVPANAWWDTRAPLTFGRFVATVLIILVRHLVLNDPVGMAAIAESMLLSVTGLILFVVSPQVQGFGNLVGTAIGFAFSLWGFIRVALGSKLKAIAPLVYYVAFALAMTSVVVGGLSVARLG